MHIFGSGRRPECQRAGLRRPALLISLLRYYFSYFARVGVCVFVVLPYAEFAGSNRSAVYYFRFLAYTILFFSVGNYYVVFCFVSHSPNVGFHCFCHGFCHKDHPFCLFLFVLRLWAAGSLSGRGASHTEKSVNGLFFFSDGYRTSEKKIFRDDYRTSRKTLDGFFWMR